MCASARDFVTGVEFIISSSFLALTKGFSRLGMSPNNRDHKKGSLYCKISQVTHVKLSGSTHLWCWHGIQWQDFEYTVEYLKKFGRHWLGNFRDKFTSWPNFWNLEVDRDISILSEYFLQCIDQKVDKSQWYKKCIFQLSPAEQVAPGVKSCLLSSLQNSQRQRGHGRRKTGC